MPTSTTKFRKLALTPGEYTIQSGGTKVKHRLDPGRLRRMVDNTKRLMASGAKVPVPYAHADEKGNQPAPVLVADEGAFIDYETNQPIGWRSDLNAGFVKDMTYGRIKDETGAFREGIIVDFEVPGDANDPNSAAYKFGKSIRETSLGIRPNYTDSKNNNYGEAIVQVAAVTHPVEFAQPNFGIAMNQTIMMGPVAPPKPAAKKPGAMPKGKPAIAPKDPLDAAFGDEEGGDESGDVDPMMDGDGAGDEEGGDSIVPLTDDDDPNGLGLGGDEQAAPTAPIDDLIQVLQQWGLNLPLDTTPANLIDRLRLVTRQKLTDDGKADQLDGGNMNQPRPPSGSQVPSSPIAMSTVPVKNPALTILLSQAVVKTRDSLHARALKLVECGRFSSEWYEKNLKPRIDGIVMNETSLTDEVLDAYAKNGRFPASDVEVLISGFESAGAVNLTTMMSQGGVASPAPAGSVPDNPLDALDASNQWYNDQANGSGDSYSDADDDAIFALGAAAR